MKKCGRFVAGMFGTSLSLAMLSGAFLMANKGAVEAEAAEGDNQAVYTIASKEVTASGDLPDGSTASYSQTYSASGQMTKGNSATLTLSNLGGINISRFTLSMRSNKSAGSGSLSYTVDDGGAVTLVNSKAFNDSDWYGSYSNKFVDVVKDVTITNANDLEIKIEASVNSLYISSYTIDWSPASYDHIVVSGEPTKTDYYVGDSLLTDGLTVNAYATAEDTNPTDVTDLVEWSVDPATFTDTATTSAQVTATYRDVVSQPYTVDGLTISPAATVTDLIITGPTKATYGYGETVDFAGLKIEAKMSDDKTIDITNEIKIDDHIIDLADVAAGKYDIKVSYKGVDKTISLTVDEKVLTTAEFSALSENSKGIVSGTIIRVTDVYTNSSNINVYIQDNAGGLLLYSFSPDVVTGEVAVGNKIYIHGTRGEYGGVVQLTNPTEALIGGAGEEITPFVVTEFSADALDGKSNTLVTVNGLTYVSGDIAYLADGQYKPGNVSMELGSTKITLRAPTNAAAESMKDDFPTYVETRSGLPLNFTGILGWYNGAPQIAPVSMDDFACPAYDEILNFIKTYMHMDQWVGSDASGNNECLTLFPAAKEALEKLSEAQQTYFLNSDNPEIAEAQARYKAWKAAQGDQSAASVIMNTVNENKGAIIAVSAVAALGIAGAAALLISRKKRSAKNK